MLAGKKISRGRFLGLVALFGACTVVHYLGMVSHWLGWPGTHQSFWFTDHDFHHLLFLAPIIWAGYFFGVRAAWAVTVASLAVFVPQAVFMSSPPEALGRAVLDGASQGIVGSILPMARTLVRSHNTSVAGAAAENAEVFTSAGLEVNLSRRIVRRHGQVVKLTKTEYELLSCLVRNNGKVMKHEELLHSVWGPEYGQETEYLRTFVRQLRRKLEDDPSDPRFIKTEPGFGYRFEEMNGPLYHL